MIKHNTEYDERYILKILPKIAQWESIPYALDLICQECREPHRYASVGNTGHTAKIVGWVECEYGYQLVFECPYCFTKFRYHPHDKKYDIDDFVDRIMYNYVGNELFANGNELEKKWNDYELSHRI